MRRVAAIWLVSLFSFSLIAPALSVEAESNLPACCRRDGKHHCGMLAQDMADMAEGPQSGPAVDALHARCPFFPTGGAVLPNPEGAVLAAFQPAGIAIAGQIAIPAHAAAGCHISFNTSHQKRGPPSLLS
jgi:hypothetical protein